MPGRHQKDKPPQREHRRSGVTKQYAGRRPEPVSPAGNPQTEDAPKGNAATLRPTTDALLSIRFRGSMRELFFGEISPVWRGENSPKNSRIEPLKPQASQVVDNQGCYLEVHGEGQDEGKHDLQSLTSLAPLPLRLSGSQPFTQQIGQYIMIGERTNVAGSPKFAKLIKENKYEEAVAIARQQVENGANIIDICMDEGMIDGVAAITRFFHCLA